MKCHDISISLLGYDMNPSINCILQILRTIFVNSAQQIPQTFPSQFFHFKIISGIPKHYVYHTSILYVLSRNFVLCAFLFLGFIELFYFFGVVFYRWPAQ